MADSTEVNKVEQALQSLVGKRIVKIEIEDVDADAFFQRMKITPKDGETVIIESADFEGYSSSFALPKEEA